MRRLAAMLGLVGLVGCSRSPASGSKVVVSAPEQRAGDNGGSQPSLQPQPIILGKGPGEATPLPCDSDCKRDSERVAHPWGSPQAHLGPNLEAFFGGLAGGYTVPDWTVAEQVCDAMENPNPVSGVADGELLISGCRRRVCGNDGAIIVRPDGTVLAAAIVSRKHRYVAADRSKKIHEEHPVLTTFLRPGDDSDRYEAAFTQWAPTYGLPIYSRETVFVSTSEGVQQGLQR